MKQSLSCLCIVIVLMLTIPLISFAKPDKPSQISNNANKNSASQQPDILDQTTSPQTQPEQEIFRVFNHKTNEIMELSASDYIKGVVAAEMPANFHTEALKAQAVAAYTYAKRVQMLEKNNPTKSLNGADFSTDPATHQAYFSPEEVKSFYGDHYDQSAQAISNAVDAVIGKLIVYNEQPIAAAFHAMSSGKTESSQNVWGTAIPYLTPVDSASDKDAPKYKNETTKSCGEIQSLLTKLYSDLTLPNDPTQWFSIQKQSDSNTILSVKVGNKTLTGMELRSALGLRSSCFEINYQDDAFTFTTYGSGHGVGMSQYGANHLAEQGYTYDQILTHYYQGTTIV